MDYTKIPERLTETPKWIILGEEINEDIASDDLISVAFWHLNDQLAHERALKAIKKGPVWYEQNKQDPESLIEYAKEREKALARMMEAYEKEPYVLSRMLAQAHDLCYDGLGVLDESVDRIQMTVALRMEEEGLLKHLELDTVDEYLLEKIVEHYRDKDDPEWHSHRRIYEDSKFLATYLLPALKTNGIDKRLILGISDNWWKARYAIPYIREILDEVISKANEIIEAKKQTKDKKELEHLDEAYDEVFKVDTRLRDALELLMEAITTPVSEGGMKRDEFVEHMRSIRNQNRNTSVPSNSGNNNKTIGWTYNTKQGGILMIPCDTVREMNRIKAAINGVVDWHLGDPETLAIETAKKIIAMDLPDDVKELVVGEKGL